MLLLLSYLGWPIVFFKYCFKISEGEVLSSSLLSFSSLSIVASTASTMSTLVLGRYFIQAGCVLVKCG